MGRIANASENHTNVKRAFKHNHARLRKSSGWRLRDVDTNVTRGGALYMFRMPPTLSCVCDDCSIALPTQLTRIHTHTHAHTHTHTRMHTHTHGHTMAQHMHSRGNVPRTFALTMRCSAERHVVRTCNYYRCGSLRSGGSARRTVDHH